MRIIVPEAPAPITPAPQAHRSRKGTGLRLGLLDNSKNRAAPFLDMVAAVLNERYRFSGIVRHRKPSAAKPVAREVIDEWAGTCDIAIVGVGD